MREVLRQEGIEQGITHPDRCPAEPDDGRREPQLAAAEERAEACAREVLQTGFQHALGREGATGGPYERSTTTMIVIVIVIIAVLLLDHRVENVLRKPRLGAIPVGEPVDDSDGLGLAAA